MKNTNIEKINKLGKVSRIILIIMRVVCIIGIVGCLVGMAGVAIGLDSNTVFQANGTASAQVIADENINLTEDLEKLNRQDFDLPGANLDVNVEESQQDGLTVYDITADLNADSVQPIKLTACMACLAGALICAAMLVAVLFGGKFANALEICESPFEENVLRTMKNFGFSLIPMGIVYLSDGGSSLTAIVLIIAIIIFTYIFRYGAELQKESDETI